MENPEGIFIYATHPIPPLTDLPLLLKQSGTAPVQVLADFDRLKTLLREVSCGCVVFDVRDASHLKQLAEISHIMRSEITAGIFQFIVLCQLEHPKLEAFLDKLNCNKILYPPYTAKGLKIALTRHMAIARRASGAGSESDEIKVRSSDLNRRGYQQQKGARGVVRETDPLATPDDCWLTKPSVARCIHGKWLSFAIGPGPVTGSWQEVKTEGVTSRRFEDRVWEWRPKDPQKDVFIREGVWRFRGRFPEFKETSWTLVGAAPELAYFKDGKLLERKMFSEPNGNLVIAKNSKAALDKLPDIQASIDFEIHLRRSGGKGNLLEYIEKRRKERELAAEIQAPDSKALELALEQELERASKDYPFEEEPKGASLELKDSQTESPENPFNGGKFGTKQVSPEKLDVFKKAQPLFKSDSRLFRQVDSESGKKARIADACKSRSPVTLWTQKRQIRENTVILSSGGEDGVIRIAYPASLGRTGLIHELKSQHSERLYLNINTRRTAIFFAQDLTEIEFSHQAIDVEVPSLVYEVQRRAALRFQFPPTDEIRIVLGLGSSEQGAIEGSIRDIGAGGLKLALGISGISGISDSKASERVKRLEAGAVFPNVNFELYGKKIQCSAQLRWKKDADDGQVFLGLQFLKISAEDSEGIHLFVMEESFEYIQSVLDAQADAEAEPVSSS